MSSTYLPTLLAPEFASHTVTSFHDHVMSLKRIPQRTSSVKRPPKLAGLKSKLVAKAKILELSAGKTMYPLNFTTAKVERKLVKTVARSEIANASRMLLQPEGAIEAFLEKKKFLLEALWHEEHAV